MEEKGNEKSDGVVLEGNWSIDEENIACSMGMESVDTGNEDTLFELKNGNESRKEIVVHDGYGLESGRPIDLRNDVALDYLSRKNWQQGVDSRMGPDLAEKEDLWELAMYWLRVLKHFSHPLTTDY